MVTTGVREPENGSAHSEITEDKLLRGRVVLHQPRQGYRVAIDSVLLAAALPVKPGQSVLDLGCGVGAVALCLLQREPELVVVGLERQAVLAALARQNAAENGRSDRLTVEEADVVPLPECLAGRFEHVAINPPYYEVERERPSPNALKAGANHAVADFLPAAVASAREALRHKGRLTLVHRAEALPEVLSAMTGFGEVTVCPLWPKVGRPAKRIVVSARKGLKAGLRLLPGLLLHDQDGAYTQHASAILEEGSPLSMRG